MAKRKTAKPQTEAPPPPPPGASTDTDSAPVEPTPGQVVSMPMGESFPQAINVQETDSTSVTEGLLEVQVPFLCLTGVYCTPRVDVRMSQAASVGWRSYSEGLQKQEAKLNDGKYVRNIQDAVRYMGEEISRQLAKQ